MEKTIEIGSQKIRLKASAKVALVCLDYFKKDVFELQSSFFGAQAEAAKCEDELGQAEAIYKRLKSLDCLQFIWAMAKCADDSMLGFTAWLDSLDAMPGMDVIMEAFLFWAESCEPTTKIKNAKAAESPQRKA